MLRAPLAPGALVGAQAAEPIDPRLLLIGANAAALAVATAQVLEDRSAPVMAVLLPVLVRSNRLPPTDGPRVRATSRRSH